MSGAVIAVVGLGLVLFGITVAWGIQRGIAKQWETAARALETEVEVKDAALYAEKAKFQRLLKAAKKGSDGRAVFAALINDDDGVPPETEGSSSDNPRANMRSEGRSAEEAGRDSELRISGGRRRLLERWLGKSSRLVRDRTVTVGGNRTTVRRETEEKGKER